MSEGEIVLYNTEDGLARVQLRAADGTVWLTQAQIAELFATSRPNITQHLTAVFQSGECEEAAVCKQDLLTAADGKRYRTTLNRSDQPTRHLRFQSEQAHPDQPPRWPPASWH